MTAAVLGIIGGSGIYDLPGLENLQLSLLGETAVTRGKKS